MKSVAAAWVASKPGFKIAAIVVHLSGWSEWLAARVHDILEGSAEPRQALPASDTGHYEDSRRSPEGGVLPSVTWKP